MCLAVAALRPAAHAEVHSALLPRTLPSGRASVAETGWLLLWRGGCVACQSLQARSSKCAWECGLYITRAGGGKGPWGRSRRACARVWAKLTVP